jgi:hypothetical protein
MRILIAVTLALSMVGCLGQEGTDAKSLALTGPCAEVGIWQLNSTHDETITVDAQCNGTSRVCGGKFRYTIVSDTQVSIEVSETLSPAPYSWCPPVGTTTCTSTATNGGQGMRWTACTHLATGWSLNWER